jgi:hypothetical protein
MTKAEGGIGMVVLRAWMWLVPIVMLAAAVLFGGIAVADGSWALFVAMLLIGLFAAGLLVLHWWLLYRFGKGAAE